MKQALAICALMLSAAGAQASGAGENQDGDTSYLADGVFTYEVFEAAVDHADLEDCPAEFASEDNFCRLTLAADMAHVFVFSYDGDQPLVAVRSYELGGGFLPL